MAKGTGGQASGAWMAFVLLLLAGWLGITVFVAATNADPSDPTPILRTFALAGGVFFGVILLSAAVQMRRQTSHVNEAVYRRLAVHDVPRGTLRAATRKTQRIGQVYLLFAAVGTALMLTTIGLGEDGPWEALLATGVGLVLVWLVVMVVGLGRVFKASGSILAPLGLSVTAVPSWVPRFYGGGGDLIGDLGFSGERHGRKVSIAQRPKSASTAVQGTFTKRKLSSAGAMATMTGEPAKWYRNVEATAGPDGVAVHRKGNGAGRYLYHDLLLAERLADSTSPSAT